MTKAAAVNLQQEHPVEIVKGSGTTLEPSSLALLATLVAREQVPVEAIEKLVQLHREEQDRSARRQFFAALAHFQHRCPPVPKSKQSKQAAGATTAGRKFEFSYAGLDDIGRHVGEHGLFDGGFSFSFDSKLEQGYVHVTCTLRHAQGHTEASHFSAPIDQSGAMNASQKVASALTYARRQSLVQALGITTADPDDDVEGEVNRATITPEQAAELEELVRVSRSDREAFLRYAGAGTMEEIPSHRFEGLKADLHRKLRKETRG